MDKITALKQTIYNVENDIYEYSWTNVNSCNCGVLARTLLGGKYPTECGYRSSSTVGYGCEFGAKAYCLTTNLPLPEVFSVLKEAGFTHQELVELETLGNEEIGKKSGLNISEFKPEYKAAHMQFNIKQNLIKYLKAWVEILEEQQPKITYPDITKQLAVLPTEEKTDVIKTIINAR